MSDIAENLLIYAAGARGEDQTRDPEQCSQLARMWARVLIGHGC